jgi:hypothetical protein
MRHKALSKYVEGEAFFSFKLLGTENRAQLAQPLLRAVQRYTPQIDLIALWRLNYGANTARPSALGP